MRLEKDGKIFFRGSNAAGLCGTMLGILAHGSDVEGATLFCAHLTASMARLAAGAGVTCFDADRATPQAIAYLQHEGLELSCRGVSEEVGPSDLFERTLSDEIGRALTIEELQAATRAKTLAMIDNYVPLRDEFLLSPSPERLGYGGGGT